MTVRTHRHGSAMVLNVCGCLTAEADPTPLYEPIGDSERSATNIVINLEQLDRLDCAGIGQLVRLHCAQRRLGGVLTLANVDRRHRRMLELAGLLRVLDVCSTLEEALQRTGASDVGRTPRPKIDPPLTQSSGRVESLPA